jgi:hypothetical protein
MQSPELGAGPVPGLCSYCPLGSSKPLPSGVPSPEFGAGPTLVAANTVPQIMLAQTKARIVMPKTFFIFFVSFFYYSKHSIPILNLRDIMEHPFQKMKPCIFIKNLKKGKGSMFTNQ